MTTRSIVSLLSSGSSSFVSSVTETQTYRNIAFLLLRLPLGIVYFSVFLTGIAVGISLVPLVVGIPILAGVLGLADYAGVFEAKICRRFLGMDIEHAPVHDATEEPLVQYLKKTLTEPRLYLLVVYYLVSMFVGIATFTAVIVVFSVGVSLIVAPLVYPFSFTNYQVPELGSTGGSVVVDTLPEALVASLIGFGILFAGIYFSTIAATVHGRFTSAVIQNGTGSHQGS